MSVDLDRAEADLNDGMSLWTELQKQLVQELRREREQRVALEAALLQNRKALHSWQMWARLNGRKDTPPYLAGERAMASSAKTLDRLTEGSAS